MLDKMRNGSTEPLIYKDTSAKLILLFNLFTKKLEFSNVPLSDYIEWDQSNKIDAPPFLPVVEKNDVKRIVIEWQQCLLLKENETGNFNCTISKPDGKRSTFQVSAWGVNLGNTPAVGFILFSIEEMPEEEVTSSAQWESKYESLKTMIKIYDEQHRDFLDHSSHDLNAPLRRLSVFVDRLTEKPENLDPEEIQTIVSRIKRTVSGMQNLIESITELSKVTINVNQYVPCELSLIIKKIIQSLQNSIKEKNAEITINDMPVIEGDPEQLEKLFRNLIVNSLQFNKHDVPVQISIKSGIVENEEKRLYNLPNNKSYSKIEISDNGSGFKIEYANKIFQPFVRLHAKTEHSGPGLGLSVCKKIIDNHHGIIFAEGNENLGAQFIVILPKTI